MGSEGRIILKSVLWKEAWRIQIALNWLRLRFSVKSHEDGGGHSARAVGKVKVFSTSLTNVGFSTYTMINRVKRYTMTGLDSPLGTQEFRAHRSPIKSALVGGKVVSPNIGRLYPRIYFWYSLVLEAESKSKD